MLCWCLYTKEAARYGYELRLFDEAGFAYRGPLLSVTVETSKFWSQVFWFILTIVSRWLLRLYCTGSPSPCAQLGRTWQLFWDNCQDFQKRLILAAFTFLKYNFPWISLFALVYLCIWSAVSTFQNYNFSWLSFLGFCSSFIHLTAIFYQLS